jgi:hypothetical protein
MISLDGTACACARIIIFFSETSNKKSHSGPDCGMPCWLVQQGTEGATSLLYADRCAQRSGFALIK